MNDVCPNEERGQVLVVDDEEQVLQSLRRLLRRDFDVHLARSAAEGYAILEQIPIQVIVSDQRMPDITGAEFFSRVKEAYPHAIRLMLTAYADLDAVISAVNDGNIYRYITKPWNPEELPAIVRDAYAHYRAIVRNIELVNELRAINEELEARVQMRTADLQEALDDLSRSEQRLREITHSLAEGLVVIDRDGRITMANPEAVRLLGRSEDELLGRSFHDCVHRHVPAGGAPANGCRLLHVLSEPDVLRGYDDAFSNQRGEVFPVSLSAAPLHRGDQRVGTVIAFQDVTERKRLESELERLATQDPLTGLLNRRELLSRLAADISRMRRYRQSLAVLMMDLDHFKQINDVFGHPVGDELLCALARLFEDTVRAADYVARYGGEEFVVVLPQTAGVQAVHLAERIRERVATAVFSDRAGRSHRATISIGLASFPEDASDVEGLFAQADKALYLAKERGRNRIEPSSES